VWALLAFVGSSLPYCLLSGCGPRQFGATAQTPGTSVGGRGGYTAARPSSPRRVTPPPQAPILPLYADNVQEGAPWSGMQLAMQPTAEGILVGIVVAGSPAADAGIQAGDFIFQLDGQRVADALEVMAQVDRVGVGGSVRVGVHRAASVRLFRLEPVAKPSLEVAGEDGPTLPSAALESLPASEQARD
jgi:predicted metalloprotease with PDZ domain